MNNDKPIYTAKQADAILSMFEGMNSMDRGSLKLMSSAFRATVNELRRREAFDIRVNFDSGPGVVTHSHG